MNTQQIEDTQEFIFCRYITKNGKRIYRKGGGLFKIPVAKLKSKK
ncbi:hypothetical protein ACUYOF_23315 [Photobacterium ganghwense]